MNFNLVEKLYSSITFADRESVIEKGIKDLEEAPSAVKPGNRRHKVKCYDYIQIDKNLNEKQAEVLT